VEAARASALARPRDSAKLRADAADMRARMRRERPGGGLWELKLSSGGLVDLEFAVQTLCLLHAPGAIAQGTQAQIATLAAAGALASEIAARLSRAAGLLLSLRQLVDLSVSGVFDPATASQALRARIAAAAEEPTIEAAAERLALAKAEIAQVCAFALSVG
jgi:glutamate-ammonia-ligase adenylyltransferase